MNCGILFFLYYHYFPHIYQDLNRGFIFYIIPLYLFIYSNNFKLINKNYFKNLTIYYVNVNNLINIIFFGMKYPLKINFFLLLFIILKNFTKIYC